MTGSNGTTPDDLRGHWPPHMPGWKEYLTAVIKARHDGIEAVCQLTLQHPEYGVLVDCDGVRLSRDVEPRTILYADLNCTSYIQTWHADLTIPE